MKRLRVHANWVASADLFMMSTTVPDKGSKTTGQLKPNERSWKHWRDYMYNFKDVHTKSMAVSQAAAFIIHTSICEGRKKKKQNSWSQTLRTHLFTHFFHSLLSPTFLLSSYDSSSFVFTGHWQCVSPGGWCPVGVCLVCFQTAVVLR